MPCSTAPAGAPLEAPWPLPPPPPPPEYHNMEQHLNMNTPYPGSNPYHAIGYPGNCLRRPPPAHVPFCRYQGAMEGSETMDRSVIRVVSCAFFFVV